MSSSIAARTGVLVGMLAAAACLSIALHAEDAGKPPEPAAATAGWEGPYVGAHIGYSTLGTSNSVEVGPAQSWDQDGDGWLGGILLGYNMEFEKFVLGFEADAAFGKVSESETRPGLGQIQITDHGQHTFRIRAGLPTSIGLLYATGGFALSDIWIRSPAGGDENFHTGFVVGAGFEHKVTDSISLRAEYLYANYGDQDFDLGPNTLETEFDSHRLRAGVSWYFW
jgi:outer membrane immunogenic protein